MATEVERGTEPTAHDTGVGCDGYRDLVSVNVDSVGVVPLVMGADDGCHGLETCERRNRMVKMIEGKCLFIVRISSASA